MRAGRQPSRWFRRSNLLTSLILVFPLFIIYQVGVLAVPEVYNGADLITAQLLRLLKGNTAVYAGINLALLLGFLLLVQVLRRKNQFDPRLFLPTVLESAVYAVTMGSLIVLVMTRILHIDPSLHIADRFWPAAAGGPESVGLIGRIILSFGAGVHEELLFRLCMIPPLVAGAERLLKLRRWLAVLLAFLISAVLFSAAHHVVGGEPWRLGVFTYRLLCGLFFATLFHFRGFAVAVYSHALYDVFVLTLRS
jgi:hypothetical protein